MTRKIKVLVFPCGSENGSEIYQALRYSLHVDLVGASSVEDHGSFRFESYVGGLRNIRDEGFDEEFGALISRLGIEVVFATHDTVLDYLAPRAATLGFFLVNGDPETTAIARRKSATYALFQDCPWLPHVFEGIADVKTWPIIVKPDMGQGGQGVALVHSASEAVAAATATAEPILVEYLPGDELTVDCFSARDRTLVWIGPRTRERVKAGITMRSRLQELTPAIEKIAATINERLKLRGPWFFQLKRDQWREWKLMEVCCRIGGAMVAQRARGINLPLMAIHDFLDRTVTPLPITQVKLIDRCIATRAKLEFDYDTVLIDLDDTLITNDFANPVVVAFIYQSIRDGKRVKLITRHAKHVGESLERARIANELFDEIIHLRDGASKAEYVSPTSIFIDNHFPERVDVARKKGVPVFDVDALEFFIR
jgi:hypothetical protein